MSIATDGFGTAYKNSEGQSGGGGGGGGGTGALVFQPGGTSSSTVFTDFGALVVAAAALPAGPLAVFLDGSANEGQVEIPAGSWVFVNAQVTLTASIGNPNGQLPLSMGNGVTLSGVTGIENVNITYNGSSPAITYSGSGSFSLFLNNVGIQGSSGPFMEVADTATLQLTAFADCSLNSNTCKVDVNASLNGTLLNGSIAASNAFPGMGNILFSVGADAQNQTNNTSILLANASSINYNDSVEFPTFNVENVQDALDQLKLYSTNVLVFQPGGTATGKVYTDLLELSFAVASLPLGPIVVYFDGSFVGQNIEIPANTYDFTSVSDTTFTSSINANLAVTFDDGAVLKGVGSFRNMFMTNAGASVVNVSTSAEFYFYLVALGSSATAPFFAVTNGANVVIAIDFGSQLGDDVNPIISVAAGCTLQISALQGSAVLSNYFTGAGSQSIVVFDASAFIDPSLSAFVVVEPAANLIFYDDTLVPVPSTGTALVQDAIDFLKTHAALANFLVFQPGGTAVGDTVFTDWPSLFAVAQAAPVGPLTIYFEGSLNSWICEIPAGAWNFTGTDVTFAGPWNSTSPSGFVTVQFADGATLSGVDRLTDVLLSSVSTTPVWTIDGAWLIRFEDAVVQGSASAPFIEVTGSLNIFLVEGSLIGDFTNPAIHATSGLTGVTIGLLSTIGTNALTGDPSLYFLAPVSTSASNGSGLPVSLNNFASNLFYDDTRVPSPSLLGVGNAQDAFDAIKVLAVPTGTPAVGDMAYWNGTNWVRIPAGAEGSTLKISGGIPTWV